MPRKKSKFAKVIVKVSRFFYYSLKSLLRLIFVDSFRVVKEAYQHAKEPEKKFMLSRKLELKEKVEVQEKKIKRLERLVYAVYQDPSYSSSDKGKKEIEEMRRELK